MARPGRPPKPENEKYKIVGISLSPEALAALRELAILRGQSQGDVVGDLVARALKAERRRERGD